MQQQIFEEMNVKIEYPPCYHCKGKMEGVGKQKQGNKGYIDGHMMCTSCGYVWEYTAHKKGCFGYQTAKEGWE